jgi:hypothetical protein
MGMHRDASREQLWRAYTLLNLRGDEDLAAVKRAYHVAAVRWHPDRAGGSTERFQRIKAAFEYVRDERLGVHPAHNFYEPAEPRRATRPRARPREQSDEDYEDAPDYRQGPRTKHGRWLWKVALAFITARVVLLCGMKLAFGDRDEAEVRARLQAMQLRAAARDTGGMPHPAAEAQRRQPAGGERDFGSAAR